MMKLLHVLPLPNRNTWMINDMHKIKLQMNTVGIMENQTELIRYSGNEHVKAEWTMLSSVLKK